MRLAEVHISEAEGRSLGAWKHAYNLCFRNLRCCRFGKFFISRRSEAIASLVGETRLYRRRKQVEPW